MLTIFATPKPFAGHIGVIQSNAFSSWAALGAGVRVIVFGDAAGIREAAARHGFVHVPELRTTRAGAPDGAWTFQRAHDESITSLLCYVNSDIILDGDLLRAAATVSEAGEPFLLCGRRRDFDLAELLDMDALPAVRVRARAQAVLHAPTGLDYFVFSRALAGNLPRFAIGRAIWDNWFAWYAVRHGARFVDGSAAIFAIHQNHDYGHVAGGRREVFDGEDARANLAIARGGADILTLDDAVWRLDDAGRLRPMATSLPVMKRRLRILEMRHPNLTPLVDTVRKARRALLR